MAIDKPQIHRFLNKYYKKNEGRNIWFGNGMYGTLADWYAIIRLRLKGIKPGSILIGPELVLRVTQVAAGQIMYLDHTPSMAISILKDLSPGEHLTGALMNTYTTLSANDCVAVINIDDLRLFKLRVATKVERLLYES